MFCLSAQQVLSQVTWKRTYGGLDIDRAADIRTTSDDGAVVVGSTGSFGIGGDMYVFRIDAFGALMWSRALGGEGVQSANAVDIGSDGTIYVVGTALVDGVYRGRMLCLSSGGEVIWARDYGAQSAWSEFNRVVVHEDGITLAGRSYSFDGPGSAWVIRTDLEGGVLFDIILVLEGAGVAHGLAVSPDGATYVTGTVQHAKGTSDAFVCRLDPDGVQSWATYHGGAMDEEGRAIALTSNGLVVVGFTHSFSNKRQMYMVRLDIDGAQVGSGPITSAGNDWEAFDVLVRADGTYAVAGYTKEYGAGGRDISLLFTQPDGSFISGPTYGGAEDEVAYAVDATSDGGYYVAGTTATYGPGALAAFVVRSDGDTLNGATVITLDPVQVETSETSGLVRLFPNPVAPGQQFRLTGSIRGPLSLTLIDPLGRSSHEWGEAGHELHFPNVPDGMYWLQVIHEATGRRIWSGPVRVE